MAIGPSVDALLWTYARCLPHRAVPVLVLYAHSVITHTAVLPVFFALPDCSHEPFQTGFSYVKERCE